MSFGFDRIISDYLKSDEFLEQSYTPGIESENFYLPGAYDMSLWDEREDIPAFWGNHITHINTHHVRVMCPYVYGILNTDHEILQKTYENVVFLPRSDMGWVDLMINWDDFFSKIYDICDGETIFISWPRDVKYYRSNMPDAKVFAIGTHRYNDLDWSYNLIKLIKRSKQIYFASFGTASVLSSMFDVKVRFYDPGKVFDIGASPSGNQYCPEFQTEQWNSTIKYFQNVLSFDGLSEDKKYLIHNFLSLDKYQTPEDLAETLRTRTSGPYSNCERLNEYIPVSPTEKTVQVYESIRIFQNQDIESRKKETANS